MCGRKGFTLISPKQVPTFMGPAGRPTTIDLTWANHISRHLHPKTSTRLNNHSSDHQPIITTITPPVSGPRLEAKHLSITIGKLDHKAFLLSLEGKLGTHTLCLPDANTTTISQAMDNLTEAVRAAYKLQGKWVKTNQHRMKPWWNTSILNPLLKERNSAIHKMIRTKTQESTLTYYYHQKIFKQKVWELKTSHWRRFLADKELDHAFQAYNFTKSRSTSEMCALKTPGGHVATDTTKKATILFEGLDRIPNELLKIATKTIAPQLSPLFNACLQAHHFPTQWKQAITVIIKKATKEDYTDPKAYRPIALLSTLAKDTMSITYVDDVTHLLAANSLKEGMEELEEDHPTPGAVWGSGPHFQQQGEVARNNPHPNPHLRGTPENPQATIPDHTGTTQQTHKTNI
ncbi:hypothetical protein O181_078465 [Austropuccinia psidii MF-1]|uniref:Reverse transcriptase domain-containing protein n=1 Tax=Austropuccinia psidii MF-1 TaxID=1389203 RepID=A0A9Q3IGZ7_9BASI|nr:hypothetical protein [Austropuccinia psidii MF-1]